MSQERTLPKHVHKKGRAFYFVLYHRGIREWHPLGTDEKHMLLMAGKLNAALLKRKRAAKFAASMRTLVFLRDGHRCVYCGTDKDLCVDHVVPVSLGGESRVGNLVTACTACNTRKMNGPPILGEDQRKLVDAILDSQR